MPRSFAWAVYALAAFGVTLLAAFMGSELGWPDWAFAAVAAGATTLAFLARPRLPTGVLVAAALAGLAAFLGARSADSIAQGRAQSEPPSYDLTQDPLPEDAAGFVELRGHLNMETHLDEYRVAAGDQPDQNAPADFELRLLLPTPELAVPADTRFVVARVPKANPAARDQGVDVVRGELKALPGELAAPLFGGQVPDIELRGVLLDGAAQAEASSTSASWFDLGLGLLAALMGLLALRGAWPREDESVPAPAS